MPWWIAGGWALELFCRAPVRPHGDLDIGILRHDFEAVRQALSTWEIFEAKAGHLTRLDLSRLPRVDVHTLWCRPGDGLPWAMELMLDDGDPDVWIYRREPRIRRPLAEVVGRTATGLPYLAPEIQLLYKSKSPRARDERDFRRLWPLLSEDARTWLDQALTLVSPHHQWLSVTRR